MKMNRKLFIALATLLLFGMLAGCKKKEDPAIAELNAQMQAAEQKQEVATTATTQTEAIPNTYTETTTEDGLLMGGTVLTGYFGTITNIIIPNSITSIGQYAFKNCSSLASVTIPNSVTSIEYGAFQSCTSLASVTIPNSVTSIGEIAFSGCHSLASITIPDSVTSIGMGTFSYCTSLISVTIPDSVQVICEGAFAGCTSLTSITIPNSVTRIEGDYAQFGSGGAFEYCTSLTSVTIGSGVTSIGYKTFLNCTSLTRVTLQCTISSDNFDISFPGDLREKYLAEGIGTYTTTAPVNRDSKWTKQ